MSTEGCMVVRGHSPHRCDPDKGRGYKRTRVEKDCAAVSSGLLCRTEHQLCRQLVEDAAVEQQCMGVFQHLLDRVYGSTRSKSCQRRHPIMKPRV